MRKTVLVMALAILGHCYDIFGQTNCAQTLRLAQSVYDQGRLHELPQLLDGCLLKRDSLRTGFTSQEKVNAYKLLTLTYIYLEEPEKADQSMLALLREDTEFKINDAIDPAEFVALYKTFRTTPIYRIGGKFGINVTQPNVTSFNPLNDGNGAYKYNLGIGGGVAAEIPINIKLTLAPELSFISKSFDATFNAIQNENNYSTTTGKEIQNWLSLPVVLQYELVDKRFKPFISAGFSVDYLLSSNITGEKKQKGFQSVESKSFDLIPQREQINFSALLGAGAKTKIGNGYLIGEVRMTYGLSSVNSAETLMSNQSLLFEYNYIDGIYKLNSLFVSVGYVKNVYKPKKKENK